MAPKIAALAGMSLVMGEMLPDATMLEKFGIVGLLTMMVAVLWKQDQKRQSKLEELLCASIQTMTEVRDAIRNCPISKEPK
jgi:hypothetical protein